MRKLPTRKLLTALIAGALLVPNAGFTLGLGEIEVNSALNQKLNADIELLSTSPEDAENIIVKLASRKEFTRAGLDRPFLLNDLRFKSEIVDGVPQIKVSSGSPIREPFLNFLVEIDWPNGHLLREYTVLLDPPVFMTQAARTVSAQANNHEFRPSTQTQKSAAVVPVAAVPSIPVVQSAPVAKTPAPKVTNTAKAAPAFIPAPVVQAPAPAPIKQAVTSHRVKSGDTAWSLADKMRPNKQVSVPQMLIALLRANPESFINENINGLKRGYILRAPDAAQIAATSDANAMAMVREHGALWRQYQQAKAGTQLAAAIPADDKQASNVDNNAAASGSSSNDNAQLSIVAGEGSATAGGKNPAEMSAQELRAELALARERVETERVKKEELQNRVETLEQSTAKMKGMLAIEDNELAGVQSLNSPTEATNDAGESEKIEEVTSEVGETETAIVADEVAASDEATELGAIVDTTEGTSAMTEEVSNDASTEDAIFTDEVSDQTAAVKDLADNKVAAAETVEPAMEDVAPESITNRLTELLNNPKLLAIGGGILLFIMALIGFIVKRRKTDTGPELEPALATATMTSDADDFVDLADEIAEETAAEALDEEMISDSTDEQVAAEDEMPAEVIEEDTASRIDPIVEADEGPRDDVIAEADVYLAYGIYQQAEDLLKQALVENPENDSYRVKLAETYSTSKDSEAFLAMASEVKSRVDNNSSEWKKVMVMGQALCADDPMFQDEMVDDLVLDATAETSADELTMDPVADDVADDSLSELNLDDSAIDLPELESDEQSEAVDDGSDTPIDEIEFDLSDTDATEEESAEDEFSLDIDASELDIDVPDEAASEVVAEEQSFDISDIDIGLDEDATVAEPEVLAEDGGEELSFDLDATAETLEDDIPLNMTDDADVAEETAVEEDEITLDLSDEVAAEEVAEAQADELEDISLDLSEEVEANDAVGADLNEDVGVVRAANDDSSEDGDFDFSSLGDVDEISTKLDLARAYMDMGDIDGTRDILDEVLSDGNDDQKQEANDLMQKLN